jgi:hypothetical protein
MTYLVIKAKLSTGEVTYLSISGIGRFEFFVREGLSECAGYRHLVMAEIGSPISLDDATKLDGPSACRIMAILLGNHHLFLNVSDFEAINETGGQQ